MNIMTPRYTPILLLALLGCISCKTPSWTAAEATRDYIHIAQGGGFTGRYQEKVLEANGRVFVKAAESDTFTYDGHISSQNKGRIWSAAGILYDNEPDLNRPGNMSRSVTIVKDGKPRKFTWSHPDNTGGGPKVLYSLVQAAE